MIIIDHLLFLSSAADAVNSLIRLTHCLLMPFESHRQITVEANVAGGYIDTGNINVSINLPWMLSDQLCKS